MPSTHNYLVQKPFGFGCKTRNVGSAKCTAIRLHLAVFSTDSLPHMAHLKTAFPSSLIPPSCKMLLLESLFLNTNLNAMLPIFKPHTHPVHPTCAPTPRRGAAGREPRRGLGLCRNFEEAAACPPSDRGPGRGPLSARCPTA